MYVTPTNLVIARTESEVLSLVGFLLGDRQRPVIVLTESVQSDRAVLLPKRVGEVLDPGVYIYLIVGDDLVALLGDALGAALGVVPGTVRIFWPGLSLSSDPSGHPLVAVLYDGTELDDLKELARQFNLSRPDVRREIRLIEDARSVLQHKLTRLENDLRTMSDQVRTTNREFGEALSSSQRSGKDS